MKAGYIQYDVVHSKEDNFRIIEDALQTMHCDIVVLPELSLCGYLFNSRDELLDTAESVPEGDSVNRMAEISEKYGCTIVFGLAERCGNTVFNTAVVVSKGRYIGKYRKIHLSDFEKRFFEAGNVNPVFDLGDIKIGVQICFDLWFPEISREQVRGGANLLCALANFGSETTYTITKTRAIENLTPIIMCNRVGVENSCDMEAYFIGKSTVLDKNGMRILEGIQDAEVSQCCDIEPAIKRSNVICGDFMSEMAKHYECL